jgi:hypothetical protein
MRNHVVGTLVLVVVALAASAAPALTADNGTVAVTIKAAAPPAPCLTVTPGAVDFGTLPFSADNGAGLKQGNSDITVTNCGTAGQNLLGSTTNAVGPGGSWTATSYFPSLTIEPCPAPDRFYLSVFGFIGSTSLIMTNTPAPVLASLGGPPAVFPAGDKVFRMSLIMPCVGSNGAGETKTLTATFTAVLP